MSTNTAIHRDLFHLLCDQQIGYGIARTVWSSRVLPSSVIKVEENAGSFQNVAEWQVWEAVKGTQFERWFAPCEWISANGSVLIQAKTVPALKYPERLPVFLTDTKRANYGLYKGRFVCHDYGKHLLLENGMTRRERKVEWWDL